jgi:hypothetical protein
MRLTSCQRHQDPATHSHIVDSPVAGQEIRRHFDLENSNWDPLGSRPFPTPDGKRNRHRGPALRAKTCFVAALDELHDGSAPQFLAPAPRDCFPRRNKEKMHFAL